MSGWLVAVAVTRAAPGWLFCAKATGTASADSSRTKSAIGATGNASPARVFTPSDGWAFDDWRRPVIWAVSSSALRQVRIHTGAVADSGVGRTLTLTRHQGGMSRMPTVEAARPRGDCRNSAAGDGDRARGVLGQGDQVVGVAGEHNRVRAGAGVGGDDRVRCRDLRGPAGRGQQPCRLARLRLKPAPGRGEAPAVPPPTAARTARLRAVLDDPAIAPVSGSACSAVYTPSGFRGGRVAGPRRQMAGLAAALLS
jgi:hypothetical protein